jgi:hypothetical protein
VGAKQTKISKGVRFGAGAVPSKDKMVWFGAGAVLSKQARQG